jgi:hypothetical protein
MNQPPKRVVTSPKRKKFSQASDARTKKEVRATDGAASTISSLFSFIYGFCHMVFVIAAVAGLAQVAYQTYTYASIRQWPSFSAFDLAKIMQLESVAKQHEAFLNTFSPGALVALIAFCIMQACNLFIKRASR